METETFCCNFEVRSLNNEQFKVRYYERNKKEIPIDNLIEKINSSKYALDGLTKIEDIIKLDVIL